MKKVLGKLADRKGFTLVETVFAVLLISVVVTSIFSLALTSRGASKKTGKRAQALFYSRQAMEKLKAYVTADTTLSIGPSSNWKFPGDTCSGCTGSPNCWALANCTHDISAMLPATCSSSVQICQAAPVSATLKYTVTAVPAGCTGSKCSKSVRFSVSWAE